MEKDKLYSYLGFASKSRNLITGYNTCLMAMAKGKIKLLIIAEDLALNTIDKMESKCKSQGIEYRIFGSADELSHRTGKDNKGIFGITDDNFANVICKEIDLIQSKEKEVF